VSHKYARCAHRLEESGLLLDHQVVRKLGARRTIWETSRMANSPTDPHQPYSLILNCGGASVLDTLVRFSFTIAANYLINMLKHFRPALAWVFE